MSKARVDYRDEPISERKKVPHFPWEVGRALGGEHCLPNVLQLRFAKGLRTLLRMASMPLACRNSKTSWPNLAS